MADRDGADLSVVGRGFMLAFLRFFPLLYYAPVRAMAGILDEGNCVVALACAFAVSLLMLASPTSLPLGPARRPSSPAVMPATRMQPVANWRQPAAAAPEAGQEEEQAPAPAAMMRPSRGAGSILIVPLLLLALVYVPATIFVMSKLAAAGGFATLLGRDYAPLVACGSMACAAAMLPFALCSALGTLLPHPSTVMPVLLGAALLHFTVLMTCTTRMIYGVGSGVAVGGTLIAYGLVGAAAVLYAMYGFIFHYLASPWLLYYLYQGNRMDMSQMGRGLQSRQALRQQLEIATINPQDADAQYQLGLIFLGRRQWKEAEERLQRAMQIDPREPDPHFQLGLLAKATGRKQEALQHFERVLQLNEKSNSYEALREAGSLQLEAGHWKAAHALLERYIDQRPYDPEGQYRLGQLWLQAQDRERARYAFQQCLDAVRTAPAFRRGQLRTWEKQANAALSGL